jgi:hypothetical protein
MKTPARAARALLNSGNVKDSTKTENGKLRQALEEACAMHGLPLSALTVLATQNDPFRVDTPTGHAEGLWLAVQLEQLGLRRPAHLRALHYRLIGRPKPNGKPYTNTDPDWVWLGNGPAKAARWLRKISFKQIIDARNNAPVIRPAERDMRFAPEAWINVGGLRVNIPDAANLSPVVSADQFQRAQPWRLAYFGEKTSLEEVLSPVANSLGADLYLPAGEISDSMMYLMAEAAADDGRPLVVLTFCDSDPSGWQMPVSISRKLQALKAGEFADLRFQVRRVGLTPAQVREFGLPSTPLKETEKRGDKWKEATGTEQTEADALLALRPDLLRQLARDAARPFYDPSLDARCDRAQREWIEACQAAVDAQTDQDHLDQLAEEANAALDQIRAEVEALAERIRIDTSGYELPAPPPIPEPEIPVEPDGLPLIDSDWDFAERCQRLIASKAYADGGAS